MVLVTTKNEIVKKSYEFINARYSMPLSAQKLLCVISTKVREEDLNKSKIDVEIHADELNAITGLVNKYEDLKLSADQLYEADFHVVNPNGKGYIRKRFTDMAEYKMDEAKVRITIREEMIPFLLTVKENLITYNLNILDGFNYKHSLRIFEMLIQHVIEGQSIYVVNFEIIDLKETLEMENSYPKSTDFKRYFLDKVNSDLGQGYFKHFKYELIKKGRKYTTVQFTFEVYNNVSI